MDAAELEKTWGIIEKTADYNTEEEYKSYVDAVKHGNSLVGDCSDSALAGLSPDQVEKAKKIAELFSQL